MPKGHKGKVLSRILTSRSVFEYYLKLKPAERHEFIKARFFGHPKSREIAKAIARTNPHNDARTLILLEESGFQYEVNEVALEHQLKELGQARKGKTLVIKEIADREKTITLSIVGWFQKATSEDKMRLLKNKLYGAEPELFIDPVFATFRETKNPEYIQRLIALSQKVIGKAVEKWYLKDLAKTGYFTYLVSRYYKELADLGYIRDIIRDGSAVRALANTDINAKRKYLGMIADVGPEGIFELIKNGFAKQLFESVRDFQIIDALGKEKYEKLKAKYSQ